MHMRVAIIIAIICAGVSHSQTIATVAGNGATGFSGDGGAATSAALNHPRGLAVDAGGSLYISDTDNYRVRRIAANGIISTFAGTGVTNATGDGGAAVSAAISDATGLAFDRAGNLYIADAGNRRIRKITPGGVISTFAGTGIQGFDGDGGAATSARLNRPTSITFDLAGNMFIADSSNHRIRRVSTSGTITTIAGNGRDAFAGDGGAATNASLSFPLGVAVDGSGNVYIADAGNNRIRRINTSGVISTVAGNGAGRFAGDDGQAATASINIPSDVALDAAGTLYIADSGNNRVRVVSAAGIITTLAGTGVDSFSGDGGPAGAAALNYPWGLTIDSSGTLYIADPREQSCAPDRPRRRGHKRPAGAARQFHSQRCEFCTRADRAWVDRVDLRVEPRERNSERGGPSAADQSRQHHCDFQRRCSAAVRGDSRADQRPGAV